MPGNMSPVMLKEFDARETHFVKENRIRPKTDYVGYALLLLTIGVTIASHLYRTKSTGKATVAEVWYYGWLTAISTGLGVIPFYFVNEPNKFWEGVSNAVAGGMMIAACVSLTREGCHDSADVWSTIFGFFLGILFILITKNALSQYEHLKFGDFEGINAQKIILIIFVMTLHSLTEGIGIGVSFSNENIGKAISLTLAVHNVPEGLAVALVLTTKKESRLRAALWAIFTSLPQPLMAVPAFMAVQYFEPLLPVGLGFAAGAMAWVAVFELLVEARNDTSTKITGIVSIIAFTAMMLMQAYVKSLNDI